MLSKTNFHRTSRWYVKKLSRRCISATSPILDQLRPPPVGKAVRVLTYHRFGKSEMDPFCVSSRDFEEHLEMLAGEGRAVSLEQVKNLAQGNSEDIPDDACLVTIDDGMISTLSIALPLLRKYRIPGVAFVSSKLIGLSTPELEERYLTWDELKELAACGTVTVGSHAHTHRSMASLPSAELRHEAITSRQLLSERLDKDVVSFAYPFGMSKDFNQDTDNRLRAAGYEIAFNSMHGPVQAGMDPISLPRVKVEGGESIDMFSSISRGGLDHWRMIDDRLWRMQRVRREIS